MSSAALAQTAPRTAAQRSALQHLDSCAPPGVQPVSRLGSPQPKDKGEGKDAKDQGSPVADASEDKGKETFSSAARASEDQGSPVADASKLFRLLQRERVTGKIELADSSEAGTGLCLQLDTKEIQKCRQELHEATSAEDKTCQVTTLACNGTSSSDRKEWKIEVKKHCEQKYFDVAETDERRKSQHSLQRRTGEATNRFSTRACVSD